MYKTVADLHFSILLVHGLIGHALHTREDSQGINWITNPKFLPKSLPTARAMKLGYNANPLSNLVTSRVLDHADGLLAGLLTMRARCQDRHLIFIAHSLGGIVVKRALITATVRNAYKAIFDSTIARLSGYTAPRVSASWLGWYCFEICCLGYFEASDDQLDERIGAVFRYSERCHE